MERAPARHIALFVCLLSACTSCRTEHVEPTPIRITAAPTRLEFGTLPLGVTETKALTLTNEARVTVQLFLVASVGDVTLSQTELALAPGASSVDVSWLVARVGALAGQVTVSADAEGVTALVIPLVGEGVAQPVCSPSSICTTAHFDVGQRACVEAPANDGAPCVSTNACLLRTTCTGGRCLGETRSCDDGNACTLDSCSPTRGCESVPRPPCPGDGVCGVGVCNPARGCELTNAADGTPCGPKRSCTEADVCVAGACVTREPPEGFVCSEASPCRGPGRCVAHACAVEPTRTLGPVWRAGDPRADGGRESWSDLLVDGDGGFMLSSYFQSAPQLGVGTSSPASPLTGARRCIAWRNWLVCADHPSGGGAPPAAITALDSKTGAVAWSYVDAPTDLPVLFAPHRQTFLARLLVQSNERLVALFESQLLDASIDRCRRFGLVLIDEQGHSHQARSVDDPLFDVCTHPHSYGAAVDAEGALYLAFAPSQTDNPATPLNGTWLVSYSPALVQRWTVTDAQLVGGELAVARGELFHEHAVGVRSTQTGQVVRQLAQPFSLGAVSALGVVQRSDAGVSFSGSRPSWSASLPWSTPPKLATWASSPNARTVVVGVAQGALVALDAAHGGEVFTCPLTLDAGVINVEIGVGSIGVMFGLESDAMPPMSCENCDPKWSRTKNRFAGFETPGLTPSSEPWPGVWGGPGHAHREQ